MRIGTLYEQAVALTPRAAGTAAAALADDNDIPPNLGHALRIALADRDDRTSEMSMPRPLKPHELFAPPPAILKRSAQIPFGHPLVQVAAAQSRILGTGSALPSACQRHLISARLP